MTKVNPKSIDNWHLEVDSDFRPLKNLRVRVVDGNKDSLELVRIILGEYGINIVTVASATINLQVFSEQVCPVTIN